MLSLRCVSPPSQQIQVPFQNKNGFEASPEQARSQFYLRLIMLTLRFELGKTFGEMAAEPETKKMWEDSAVCSQWGELVWVQFSNQ